MAANSVLYYTTFGINILSENANVITIGSIIELAIVIPLLYITWKRKWNIKSVVLTVATGLIFVRFFIPIEYLHSFVGIIWIGFAVEGIILIAEIYLFLIFIKYTPKIIHNV